METKQPQPNQGDSQLALDLKVTPGKQQTMISPTLEVERLLFVERLERGDLTAAVAVAYGKDAPTTPHRTTQHALWTPIAR